MADDTDYRAMMQRAGVLYRDDPPPATASEQMAADALGLTTEEVRFSRRLGVSPERYSASKSIRSLADFTAEMARRRDAEAAA